ncbi:hypothetical protein SAMN05421869_1599 [Nonomuraea jiangxiensis]|uniref:Uncharacterized protein n=1 Tax=Nonomuraea jiangxiensis TaxID=633440 RepID=A0A1G9WGU2_9ACTN|nr:hypothetical protein SAMN05421869_1599 [Nonomuraea jiangxiensis]
MYSNRSTSASGKIGEQAAFKSVRGHRNKKRIMLMSRCHGRLRPIGCQSFR